MARPLIDESQKHDVSDAVHMAEMTMFPDTLTQKAAFKEMMPSLHTLRKRGISFRQITALLNGAGLMLAQSTVQTYYYSFYRKMKAVCDRRAKEEVSRAREIRDMRDEQELVQMIRDSLAAETAARNEQERGVDSHALNSDR
jgi:hypothetical protein